MKSPDVSIYQSSSEASPVKPVLVFWLLALVTWVAHFYQSANLGFYAEDFNLMERGLNLSTIPQLLKVITAHFSGFGQGRPVYYTLLDIYTFIAARTGGIFTLYLICFLILTINGFLIYQLIYRLSKAQSLALISALAFCLYPADTTQSWISMNILGQSSLTFLLLAFLSYLSGRQLISYGLILGSLLCYETAFPIFALAPLLRQKDSRKRIKVWGTHLLVMAVMLASTILIRKAVGEDRVSNLSLGWVAITSLKNMILGPWISTATFFYRPVAVILDPMPTLLIVLPMSFIFFLWVLPKFFERERSYLPSNTELISSLTLKRVLIFGVGTLVLAYALTINPNPEYVVQATFGRNSRIHLSAAIGASIVFGCFWSMIFSRIQSIRSYRWATVGLSFLLAGMISFSFTIQHANRLDWQYQQRFWTDVLRLVPDMADGDILILEGQGMKPFPAQLGNSLGTRALREIYSFPRDWESVPRLYVTLNENWRDKALGDDQMVNIEASNFSFFGYYEPIQVKSSQVVLLQVEDGILTRQSEPIKHSGNVYPLKLETPVEKLPSFPKGPLYESLIQSFYVNSL